MRRNIIVAAAAFLSAGMLLAGCGRGEEITDMSTSTPESSETPMEDGQGFMQSTAKEELEDTDMQSAAKEEPEDADVQSTAKEESEEDTGEPEWYSFETYVDFSVIEENHEILEYDICAEPRYDWENILLREEEKLRKAAEDHERYEEMRRNSKENLCLIEYGFEYEYVPEDFELDYFPFDFNDDGLEDYLVCISSWEYCGSGGNSVRIYVQEEGGTLKQVLSITSRLHQGDGIHARFTVLNEKTDGYYAIVLPSNRILRYDSDTDWYEFHEGE